jgi:hypothetical protein
MNLRKGDSLVSMDVLPAELADQIAASADDAGMATTQETLLKRLWPPKAHGCWWRRHLGLASGFPLPNSVCRNGLAWACGR